MSEIEAETRRRVLAAMMVEELLVEAGRGGLRVCAKGDRQIVRGPRNIAAYRVLAGVLPPGLDQKPFAAIAAIIAAQVFG